MGSLWSKIWGSGPPNNNCGIGWPQNCVNCGPLNLKVPPCDKCSGDHPSQCLYFMLDIAIIVGVGVILTVLSDSLLGDEDLLNVFTDMANYISGAFKSVFGFYKDYLGKLMAISQNFFDALKASPGLSKLVSGTLVVAFNVGIFNLVDERLCKYRNSCPFAIFKFINYPLTFLKSVIYSGLGKFLGSVFDIAVVPFEVIILLIALILSAVFRVLNNNFFHCTNGICCNQQSGILASSSPCSSANSSPNIYRRSNTSDISSRRKHTTEELDSGPFAGCFGSGTGLFSFKAIQSLAKQ